MLCGNIACLAHILPWGIVSETVSENEGGKGVPLSDLLDSYSMNRLRRDNPLDQGIQNDLGPEEHRQFLQEVTGRNPLFGTLLAAGVPVYTALKMVGVNLGGTGEMKTSEPSLAEIGGAWTGYGQGLMGLLR